MSIVKSLDTGGRWKDVSYKVNHFFILFSMSIHRFISRYLFLVQIFDAPAMNAPVEERYEFLHKVVDKINVPHVSVVETKRCTGAADLQKQLEVSFLFYQFSLSFLLIFLL